MTVLKPKGHVNEHHRLLVAVPETVTPGPVDVMVLIESPDEDDSGENWSGGIAREWAAELTDPREDIYTLSDGKAIDATG